MTKRAVGFVMTLIVSLAAFAESAPAPRVVDLKTTDASWTPTARLHHPGPTQSRSAIEFFTARSERWRERASQRNTESRVQRADSWRKSASIACAFPISM